MKNYQQVRAEGTPYDSVIRKAAEEQGVSYDLLHKMMYIESRFDPNAQSPTGPKGIAQLTKATARAYGLSSADRLDPVKSIKAAATHMKDLLKSTGGDQSLAALAYNQGLGGFGRKQIDAFKAGNKAGVSAEGLKYMEMVQDVINPEQVGRYQFEPVKTGGALPTAASFPEATGNGMPSRVPTHAEQLQSAGLPQGSDSDPTLFQGTGANLAEGITTSTLGSGIRAAVNGHGADVIADFYRPAFTNGYQFTEEDQQTMRDSGLPASYLKTLGGASSSANLKELITHAQDSKRYSDEAAQGGTGAKLLGGLAGAIGDPFSYVPLVGQTGAATKFLSTAVLKRAGSIGLQSGVAAGLGEYTRSQVVGGDVDLTAAVAGGILFGGGLSILADGASSAIGRTTARLEANETARLTGQDSLARNMAAAADESIPTQTINGVSFKATKVDDGSVVLKDGTVLSGTNPLNPRFHGEPDLGLTYRLADDGWTAEAVDPSGKVVGTMSVAEHKGGRNVADMSVDLEYQRQGVATRLLGMLREEDSSVSFSNTILTTDGMMFASKSKLGDTLQDFYKQEVGAVRSLTVEEQLKVKSMDEARIEANIEAGKIGSAKGFDSPEYMTAVKKADEMAEKIAALLDKGRALNADPKSPKFDIPGKAKPAQMFEGAAPEGLYQSKPKADPERAAAGIQTGGFTEMGLKVLRSENPTIRSIGQDLMRSPTGMEGGSNGASKMVASDIADYLKSQDNMFFNDFNTKSEALFDDPAFAFGGQPREVALGNSYRRISDAIEKPEIYSSRLTKAETQLMESINKQMSGKLDDLMQPTKFGNKDAKPLLDSTAHGEKYVPNVYDDIALNTYMTHFGGKVGLQDMIKKSWMGGYNANPKVRARVDAAVKASLKEGEVLTAKGLREAAEKLANDKAYGISHNSEFTYSAVTNDALDAGKGLENNSFLDARHPFDSDSPVKMSDGADFRVNDLRSYRLERILPQYSRRVNGDVAIMGATGKPIAKVKEEITALNYETSRDGNLKAEGQALMGALSILTGRSRRDPDGVFGHLLRSMNDAAFVTKNAYMGVQNITEIAGLVSKGHIASLLHGVPMFNQLMGGLKKSDPAAIKELQQIVFGRELDDSIRPRRADIREALRANSDAPDWAVSAAANLKYATGEASARSPLTKILQSSTNYIVDAARQGFLNDIVTATLKGGDQAVSDKLLKASSITPKQYKGMQDVIKRFVSVDEAGKMTIKPGMMQDPRAFDLWRLGDKMASEAIQRTGSLGSQSSKAYGPGVNMALQFKTFVLRGLNSKAIRSYYDATKNGRVIENIANVAIGMGLALPFYMASTYTKSLGVPEAQREAFLEKQLDPKMLAYAAVSRSNILGAPLGVANIIGAPLGFDQGSAVRTSILAKEPVDKTDHPQMYSSGKDVAGAIGDQVPAFGLVANAAMAGHNALGLYGSKGEGEALAYRTGLYNSVKNLVPNDPVSQGLMLKWFEAQGIQANK